MGPIHGEKQKKPLLILHQDPKKQLITFVNVFFSVPRTQMAEVISGEFVDGAASFVDAAGCNICSMSLYVPFWRF